MKHAARAGLAAVTVLASFALWAQESELVFRGGVELVNVLASVRDKKDRLIADLAQTEFHIFEDGVEQEIRQFSRETELPLTIGVLVDVSTSVEDKIPDERRAANQFLKQVLRTEDKAFVIGIAGRAVLLQDLTSSLTDLQEGLNDLASAKLPPRGRRLQNQQFPGGGGSRFPLPGGNPPRPRGGPGGRGPVPAFTGTVLYDALFLAADEVLKPVTGRKVVILLSDGADYGSRVTRSEAEEALLQSDVIVYNIYVKPDGFLASRRNRGDEVMEGISDRTGGRMYKLGKTSELQKIFADIEAELRTQYSLSYAPKRGITGHGYRRIEVRVNRKDHKVRAREGYYPVSEPDAIR